MIAHNAEVANGTGLGDVGGQFNGGFNMKTKKGKPLDVVNLDIGGVVYYAFFSKIKTRKIINSKLKKSRINNAGDRALKRIKLLKNRDLQDIIRISKDFAVESGLLRHRGVRGLIKDIENNKSKYISRLEIKPNVSDLDHSWFNCDLVLNSGLVPRIFPKIIFSLVLPLCSNAF